MDWFQVVLVLHIVLSFSVIALVLMQQGKGAQTGSAFGSGSSQALFNSTQGKPTFFSRLTAICITLFFLTSLGLALLASQSRVGSSNLFSDMPQHTLPAEEPAVETPSQSIPN